MAKKTRNTSKRLESNSAITVERVVLGCIPKWRVYPRCLLMVFGSLYRFGSLEECISCLRSENEGFDEEWESYVSREFFDDVREFAEKWYSGESIGRFEYTDLTFTHINQQLFYESTMRGNVALFGDGNRNASDVKLAIEGGFGNHVEVERMRHNAFRKAKAEQEAKMQAFDMQYADPEDAGDIWGSREVPIMEMDDGEETVEDGEGAG